MKRLFTFVLIALLCCLATTWLTPACAYSTDGSTLTRTVNQATAPINSPITLTVTFTNHNQDALRGFYYVEQAPSGLEINTVSVRINGQSIDDYVLETGQEGDVSPNYIPRRWVLEIPPDFVHTNPIPGQSVVEMVYSVSASDPGTYDLDDFSWIGHQANTNPAFGYSESTDRQTLTFVSADTPVSLSCSCTNDGFAIALTGVPGYRYVIEASANLQDWAPIATNLAPFEIMDYFEASLDQRFFRAYLQTAPYLSGNISTEGFAVGITGVPGHSYVIEASTNLVDWAPVATNVAPFDFLEDTDSPLDCCFFRAYHLQP